MGFYGKVTNSSKSQFSFDKVYPSRTAMDASAADDGVFVGRYVLVEYDYKNEIFDNQIYAEDEYPSVYLFNEEVLGEGVVQGTLYKGPDYKDSSLIIAPTDDTIYRVLANNSNGLYKVTTYWQNNDGKFQKIEAPASGDMEKFNDYWNNYNTDVKTYGPGRGYDSTVWTKVYRNNEFQYVMIAELNSVVPTFDIAIDAPTLTPTIPHFDGDSTSVYYKLHLQPNWGFRIKKATTPKQYKWGNDNGQVEGTLDNNDEELNALYPSDERIVWCRTEYDKTAAKNRYYYYDKNDQWVEYNPEELDITSEESLKELGVNAAIYYNKEGFSSDYIHMSDDETYSSNDSILLKNSGRSGHDYNPLDSEGGYVEDIQELSIMLPSIGNTIAQVWNLIYGDEEANDGIKQDCYIDIQPTQAEFDTLIKQLKALDKPTKYKRLYYKIGNNYNRLGTNPLFNQTYQYAILVDKPVRNKTVTWVDGEKTLMTGADPDGLRLVHKKENGNGWEYDTKKVETVAGVINSVHDLMGMIIVDKDEVDNDFITTSSENAIYYYQGSDKKIDPISTQGDIVSYDKLLNRNDSGDVTSGTYNGDENAYTLHSNQYYRKTIDYAYDEVDTTGWVDITSVDSNYALAGTRVGTENEGQLVDFSNTVLYYKEPGETSEYYNFYQVNSGDQMDDEKEYLANFEQNIEKANIDDIYQPDTFWLKKNANTYKLDFNPVMTIEAKYYKLDEYDSGEIYVPGSYFIKDGDTWIGTYSEPPSSSHHPVTFNSNEHYYGLNYNSSSTDYTQSIDANGNTILTKTKTYDIDKSQPVKLINYENAYKVEVSPYAYIPVRVTNQGVLESLKAANGEVYKEDINNRGYFISVDFDNDETYDVNTQYYIAHWDDEGKYINDIQSDLLEYSDYKNDYGNNLYYTYRYKPVNVVDTDMYYDTNTGMAVECEGNYQAYIETGNLYKLDIENLTEVDFSSTPYESYKYFYLDEDSSTTDLPKYILSITADYNEDISYYNIPFIKVENGEDYSEKNNYYLYSLVRATENDRIPGRQYYRHIGLTKMSFNQIFDNENGITAALYCNGDTKFKHYRLSVESASSVFISIKNENLIPQTLYTPKTYYYKTILSNGKIAYIRDNTNTGTPTYGYVIDKANYYSASKDYYIKVGDNYVPTELAANTYKASEYYILKPFYNDYYTWNISKEKNLIVKIDDFYKTETYYYEHDGNKYLDNSPIPTPGRTYYKIIPYYIVRDDLNAYSKGAEWNINVLPVPKSIHLAKRKEYVKWQPLDGFARTLNTVHGLILKINKMLESGNALTRNSSSVQGCINQMKDIIARFGAIIPGTFMIGDSYGRIKGAEFNSSQNDLITNYGVPTENGYEDNFIVADNKRDENNMRHGRWLDIQLYNYFFHGKGYLTYQDAYDAMNAEDIVFGVLETEGSAVRKYYYSWNIKDQSEFDLYKAKLSTATIVTEDDLIKLKDVQIATTYDSNTLYWYYFGTDISNAPASKGELYHMALENDAEIRFTHSYNPVEDTTTKSDLNIDTTRTDLSERANNKTTGDDIKLYTPIIDATGHVVGHNEETVTLPYGFKIIDVKEQSTKVEDMVAVDGKTIADNTQDTLSLATGNKWIKLANNANDDSVTFAHEVHTINTTPLTTDYNTLAEKTDVLTLQDLKFDNAGHVTDNQAHSYTLPYGFKTITTNGRGENLVDNTGAPVKTDIVADNTQDTLAINSGNKWIKIDTDTSIDTLTISHDIHTPVVTELAGSNMNGNGDILVLKDIVFDEAGHMIKDQAHPWILPYGYKSVGGDEGQNSVASNTQDHIDLNGDSWIKTTASEDQITFTHIGPVEVAHTAISSVTPKFGDTFDILDLDFDTKGHKTNSGTHTVTIPKGSLVETTAKTAGNVLTTISFVDTAGAITVDRTNLGDLQLGTYTAPTGGKNILSTNTLASVISTLDNRIYLEEEARKSAINNLDVTGTTAFGANKTISAWSESDGKVSITSQDISIASSQINDLSDSYSSTGTVAVTGKAIRDAIDNLVANDIPDVTLSKITDAGTMAAESKEDYVSYDAEFEYDEDNILTITTLIQKVKELEERIAELETK